MHYFLFVIESFDNDLERWRDLEVFSKSLLLNSSVKTFYTLETSCNVYFLMLCTFLFISFRTQILQASKHFLNICLAEDSFSHIPLHIGATIQPKQSVQLPVSHKLALNFFFPELLQLFGLLYYKTIFEEIPPSLIPVLGSPWYIQGKHQSAEQINLLFICKALLIIEVLSIYAIFPDKQLVAKM